jgi:hypothetical protein
MSIELIEKEKAREAAAVAASIAAETQQKTRQQQEPSASNSTGPFDWTRAPTRGRTDRAKCYSCRRIALLSACYDCSYMLCDECIQEPDHHLRLGNFTV